MNDVKSDTKLKLQACLIGFLIFTAKLFESVFRHIPFSDWQQGYGWFCPSTLAATKQQSHLIHDRRNYFLTSNSVRWFDSED